MAILFIDFLRFLQFLHFLSPVLADAEQSISHVIFIDRLISERVNNSCKFAGDGILIISPCSPSIFHPYDIAQTIVAVQLIFALFSFHFYKAVECVIEIPDSITFWICKGFHISIFVISVLRTKAFGISDTDETTAFIIMV